MIKKVIFLFLTVYVFSFGQINDSRNILSVEDKEEIQKKIDVIENEGKIKYYVNLGRVMDDKEIVEKTIILNIVPDGKNDVNVQLKFTQDIDVASYDEELNNLLVENEEAINKKEYKKVILDVLEISDKIVTQIKKDEVEVQKQEVKHTFFENKFTIFLIFFFILIIIFVTLRFMKLKGIKKR